MDTFNPHQYEDLLARPTDAYAHTKYEYIKSWFCHSSPQRVLNAGCGSGELSFLLAAIGHTVFGIDPAKEYIALAREATPPHLKMRCHFEVQSIETMPPPNELFDAIVSTDVLEHIKDDKAAIGKLVTLLRPGGLLIIVVPALPSLFGYHDEILGHYRRYTKTSLKALLLGTHYLAIVADRYFGFFFIPMGWLYSRLLRKEYPPVTYQTLGEKRPIKLRLLSFLVNSLLALEKRIAFPLGTSLFIVCKKK